MAINGKKRANLRQRTKEPLEESNNVKLSTLSSNDVNNPINYRIISVSPVVVVLFLSEFQQIVF